MSMILVNGLNKSFGEQIAIENISFNVDSGEIFGFLGPSGSGKTTTINILTNQLNVDSGIVKILGKNSSELIREDYYQIGIMSDTVGFYEKMSLYKNLEFFIKFHKIDSNKLDFLLKELDLWDSRNKKAEKLSTGMKQRMLLIRAILHKPRVLFLDEPTSGLDPNLSKKVHNILLGLKDEGTTIFLTTHNMNEASKLCDKVALLYKGRIVENGKVTDILDKYSIKQEYVMITYDNGEVRKVLRSELNNYISDSVKRIDYGEVTLEDIFIKLTGDGING